MEKRRIQFGSIRDIEEFVRITAKLRGSVSVSRGEQVMDGKAILGLLSLGLHRPLTLSYEGERAEFDRFTRSIAHYFVPAVPK